MTYHVSHLPQLRRCPGLVEAMHLPTLNSASKPLQQMHAHTAEGAPTLSARWCICTIRARELCAPQIAQKADGG